MTDDDNDASCAPVSRSLYVREKQNHHVGLNDRKMSRLEGGEIDVITSMTDRQGS